MPVTVYNVVMDALTAQYDEAFESIAPFTAQDIDDMEYMAEVRYAEQAWLRAAEYDPQSQDDL